jgi:hypothetical protein
VKTLLLFSLIGCALWALKWISEARSRRSVDDDLREARRMSDALAMSAQKRVPH